MWKNYLKLFIILLCVIAVDSVQAKAYTVKVQADTIYAEVIPESYLKNAPVVFKKAVKKTMKYYNKYKDADMVTYLRNVPKTYRDFVDIARKIRDSDEITLYSLHGDYDVTVNEEDKYAPPTFSFLAERSGKSYVTLRYVLIITRKNLRLFTAPGSISNMTEKRCITHCFILWGRKAIMRRRKRQFV